MSPRHQFKNISKNYYSHPHFAETPEYEFEQKVEKKIEMFCNKLKYTFLWRLRKKKNG